MDLLDDPGASPTPEGWMKRMRKIFVVLAASGLALFITIRDRGQQARLGVEPPVRVAVGAQTAAYDLAELPIFVRTLYYVREHYFDKSRINPRRMLVGALDFLQRDVPEILIDRFPEREPERVQVMVGGKTQEFSLEGVDSPWTLRAKLKDIMRFIQPNLQPVSAAEEGRRLVEIESAATNGMLYTLDPHSVLLDVESFKDMRTTTQGKFGGLGIVIGMDRKSRIVVRKPMPGTPALRAGLKSRDHIVRINDESTVNMTLTEAVERLRGDVGSPVDVYIERDGEKKARKFTVVRDFIRPPSIDPPASVLQVPARAGRPAVKIGFLRMTGFTANTDSDLNEALRMFQEEKVRGLVMDLRGNPGGLYDQAQKVADAFIESGVLVSMVGVGGTQRRDEHATRGDDVKLPLAVLVNQNSASASEIVAGALKHLDRGVVIGETTFGKGSVQMLFDVTAPVKLGLGRSGEDKLGLKLTTAQYLTAGNISIQSVGVTPDVQLDRMNVRKDGDESWISLQPSSRRRQESDYEWHLDNPTDTKASQPHTRLSYLYVPPDGMPQRRRTVEDEDVDLDGEGGEEDDWDYEAQEKALIDFPVVFARDLLAQARSARRSELLEQSAGYFEQVRREQDRAVTEALGKLGVDWSAAPAGSGEGQVAFSLAPVDGQATIQAGERLRLRGSMRNTGKVPVYRGRAVLRSENAMLDENEMVFGTIPPGETRTYDLSVPVGKSALTRSDLVRAEVYADGKVAAEVGTLALNIVGKPRPLFAYSYQVIDDGEGSNGDGRVQPGEKLRILVTVKNAGAGAALRPRATLRNGPGQSGILISKGRFERNELPTGERWPVSFTYEVARDFSAKEHTLELTIADRVLGEVLSDNLRIPIAPGGRAPDAGSGVATVIRPAATVRAAPDESALVLGSVAKGVALRVTGRQDAYTRVELGPERPGWIATADLQAGGTPPAAGGPVAMETLWQVMPPVLVARAPTEVPGESVRVTGEVSDDKQVRDLFIRVWNRDANMPAKKVYYRRNEGDPRKLSFAVDVPLWPGSNLIQVFARETTEVQAVQTLIVRRGGPALVQGAKAN